MNPSTSTVIHGVTRIEAFRAGSVGDLAASSDGFTVKPSPDAEQIDGAGRYAVPGLIDCHDHLAFKRVLWSPVADGGALMSDLMSSTDECWLRVEHDKSARHVLASGITTVRDFGVDLGAARAAAGDRAGLPRLITSTVPLAVPGGHLHHRATEVQTSDDVIEALAKDVNAGGAAWVKLFASGGIANYPDSPISVELSSDLMAVAVDFAHARGMRVAAHCLPTQAILNAVAAGVDSIEHGVFLTPEIAAEMADRGVWYVPTLAGYARRVDALRSAGQLQAANSLEREVVRPHAESVRLAHEAGVRIVVGTDITASVVDEMVALVEVAGLAPDEVLWGATLGAAELLGLQDGTGTLDVGARADAVVVEQDPRRDLRTLESPVAVIQRGRLATRRSSR